MTAPRSISHANHNIARSFNRLSDIRPKLGQASEIRPEPGQVAASGIREPRCGIACLRSQAREMLLGIAQ
jgi:hypothetical protein